MKVRAILLFAAVVATCAIVTIHLRAQVGREDCVPYDAATLRLTLESNGTWLISRADGARFIGLDSRDDANVMMDVFRAHTQLCYVGRDNTRPDRQRYVHHYWK